MLVCVAAASSETMVLSAHAFTSGNERSTTLAPLRSRWPRAAAARVAPLPSTASPLMSAIYARSARAVRHGTVPAEQFLIRGSRAHATVTQHTPNIIARRAEKMRANWSQRELYLRSYEWMPETAVPLLEALKDVEHRRRTEGAAGPLVVRILVDQHPPPILSNRFHLATYDVGAGLMEQLADFDFDPRYVRVEARVYRHLAFGSMHSKGAAGDDWADFESSNVQPQDPSGRNAGFEFSGRGIAEAWKSDFMHYWDRSSSVGERMTRSLSRMAWRHGSTPRRVRSVPRLEAEANRAADGPPMLLVTHRPQGWLFARGDKSPRNQALYAALDHTNGEINIMAPNLNSKTVQRRILGALKRGTRVNLLLSLGFNAESQSQPLQGGSNYAVLGSLYLTMEAEGIPTDLLDARWYRDPSVTSTLLDPRVLGSSHVRYMSFTHRDSSAKVWRLAFVGSTLPDHQSMHHSGETDVVVDDTPIVQEWDEDLFLPLFEHALPAWPPPVSILGKRALSSHSITYGDHP